MPKGPSTTQYIGGIVADQLSKMAATIIGIGNYNKRNGTEQNDIMMN